MKRYNVTALLCLALSSCVIAPSTITMKKEDLKKEDRKTVVPNNNGAIYSDTSARFLFEDRRPKFIGDTITIVIVENTVAGKNTAATSKKSGSTQGSVGPLFGNTYPNASVSASNASAYDEAQKENSGNNFSGSITVNVIDVLQNGFLVVSGEKQISLDKQTEYVRFSGIVNPDNIGYGNNIPSTKVSDARVEYRSGSKLDAAYITNVLSRFFHSINPL